jgi:ribonuclease Z
MVPKHRSLVMSALALGLASPTIGWPQVTDASRSVARCQRVAAKESRKLTVVTQNAIATCLGRISDTVVGRNQATPDVSAATTTCLAQFFRLGRSDGRSAADKMKAKILEGCDPTRNAHGTADVLGGDEQTVQQSIAVRDLDGYCGAFAAGSRTLADWVDCLRAAAECRGQQQNAVDFPRGLEWLALMAAELATSSSNRAADAQTALARIDTAIEGATDDDRPEIACGPDGAEGAIPVGDTPPAPAATCSDPPSPISLAIEAQVAARQAAADAARAELLDPTVITVVTCGTGSPVPPPVRAQACTAVFVNGKFLLFDAGDGAQRSMETLNLPVVDLTAVFLTHFHSDHIADLGEVISRSWIFGRTSTVPIYGGEAVDRVVDGFNRIYSLDEVYRTAHHGQELFPPGTFMAQGHEIMGAGEDGVVVFDQDGVTVRAYRVDHSPIEPALGYRVEYAGRSVVVSGDTVDTAGLRNAAAGADVLVSEVMNKSLIREAECALGRLGDERNETLTKDIRTYHIDVAELGELAEAAGVATLVLTHQVPALDGGLAETFFRAPIEAMYGGTLVVADDGDRITIPIE